MNSLYSDKYVDIFFYDEYIEYAYFDIDETFHGLKVDKIVTTTAEVDFYAIFLQAPVVEVEKKLESLFYLGFTLSVPGAPGGAFDCGTRPVLTEDTNDRDRSILRCKVKQDLY